MVTRAKESASHTDYDYMIKTEVLYGGLAGNNILKDNNGINIEMT